MIMEPLTPSISPHQMDMLRVVTAMAWSDGELEPDEEIVILNELTHIFAPDPTQQRSLVTELKTYLSQNLPLEDSLKHIRRKEDRQLVLRLSYQVIQASRRKADEPMINLEEAVHYQKLVQLLDLPPAEVEAIKAEVTENMGIKGIAAELYALTSS
jgi:hypothetical protein